MIVSSTAQGCDHGDKVDVNVGGCMQSLGFFGQLEQACPKRCSNDENEDDRNGLPQCLNGESEWSRDSCHTNACGEFLGGVDDAKVQALLTGFESCTGPYAGYLEHFSGDSGADVIKMIVSSTAHGCDHGDKVDLNVGGCYGSFQ